MENGSSQYWSPSVSSNLFSVHTATAALLTHQNSVMLQKAIPKPWKLHDVLVWHFVATDQCLAMTEGLCESAASFMWLVVWDSSYPPCRGLPSPCQHLRPFPFLTRLHYSLYIPSLSPVLPFSSLSLQSLTIHSLTRMFSLNLHMRYCSCSSPRHPLYVLFLLYFTLLASSPLLSLLISVLAWGLVNQYICVNQTCYTGVSEHNLSTWIYA